jgi:ATP-dependent DNA ligase
LPVRELPDGGQWTYEAKLDGYRCLAAKQAILTFA